CLPKSWRCSTGSYKTITIQIMSDTPHHTDQRALLQRSLVALDRMQAKLDAMERAAHEPIAVIGMGCRFPGGGNSPQEFWKLLQGGYDGISQVPSDRWNADTFYDPDPTRPGKTRTRYAGFLDQVDRFDPYFFGIS